MLPPNIDKALRIAVEILRLQQPHEIADDMRPPPKRTKWTSVPKGESPSERNNRLRLGGKNG